MIGVIMWSSAAKAKAVIWCEDHAALAYLQGVENLTGPGAWPEVGDLVELECDTLDGMRYARSVNVISGQKRTELPGLLRSMNETQNAQKRPVLRVVSSQLSSWPDEPRPLREASGGR